MDNLTVETFRVPAHIAPGGNAIRMRGTRANPLFCLPDVCRVIGIGNPSDVAKRISPDDLDQIEVIDNLGRPQQVTFVTESGFYLVILRSDKPQAVPFQRHVTREVLPSIREHGCWPPPSAKGVDSTDTLLAAIENIQSAVDALRAERERELAGQTNDAGLARRLAVIEARLAPRVPGTPKPRPKRRVVDPRFANGTLMTAVMEYLERIAPNGARCPDIADTLDAKEDSVRNILHRLKFRGRTIKKGWLWSAVAVQASVPL